MLRFRLPCAVSATLLTWCACTVADEPSAADVAPNWINRRIEASQRGHWAFQPLQTVTIPDGEDFESAHPIDRFLNFAQRQANVAANPLVDRRRLLRRLHFILIGLPPSFEETKAFAADESPDAIERCVDRLLASPHYGERWGRHWLDVARFAESHGYEHDYDRLTAYHYRDFVVQSFNADQPFDEFARWQIAGDRLVPENRHAWMATGFLAAGPHSTQITKREVERQRYDELDDTVSTLGIAFLGLNIGCARCHDHPYDPIPQGDFYRLAAFFTRTVRSDVEFDFDPESYRRGQVAFSHETAHLDRLVARYETGTLRSVYRKWRQRATPEQKRVTWQLPDFVAISSEGPSKWTPQSDGSWLMESPPQKTDRYEIILRPRGTTITALRLEALTAPTMTHGGPGRAPDGTFRLSELQLSRGLPKGKEIPVPIGRVEATFEQVDAGVAGVLDSRAETAWGIDPQLGRGHAVVLNLSEPVDMRRGEELRLTLSFVTQPQAAMGRVRVAISSESQPEINLESPPVPERAALALQQEITSLNENDWDALAKWFGPQDAEWQRLDALRQEHAANAPQPFLKTVLVATEGRPAIRLHTQAEREFLPETHYLQRGDVALPVGIAKPEPLQLFPPREGFSPRDRTDLAHWLTDVDHGAGALVARVIVNRLWLHHFGAGLVATPDDFGLRGDRRTHPELLDWLAAELIRHGWCLKPIHRLIVTSAAFRRSSFPSNELQKNDSQNANLWRWSPRRLDAEALRDAQWSVVDGLDDRLAGPSQREPDHARRSLYTFIKRSASDAWLAGFDAPDGCRIVGSRSQTTTPRQALTLLNSSTTRTAAERLAALCRENVDPIPCLFQRVLQRSPSPMERQRVMQFLQDHSRETGWIDLCHVLLCVDEIVFLD